MATAGSVEKLEIPLSLGANQAVTYDRLAEIEPVDIVFDPVGGQLLFDSIKLLRPLGVAVAIGFAGGLWPPLDPALLVGRNVGVQGFYLGRLMQRRSELVREAALDLLRLWRTGRVHPIVGSHVPARGRGRGTSSDRGATLDRQGRARHVKAIVTGGASGIGAAIVARLRAEEVEVEILDLTNGFDVTEPEHWDDVGPVEIASLNAGVLGGAADPAEISVERYRRTMRVNVDGVVLGVRRLAPRDAPGGRIVVTASLAGLTPMPSDPVYAASKHAVIGFVRSIAAPLETRGISINAVCPGIADTPMVGADTRERLSAADFPLALGDRGRRRRSGSRWAPARPGTHGSSSPAGRPSTSASRTFRAPVRRPATPARPLSPGDGRSSRTARTEVC